jgi:D-sedoheptulose 7-phosphate isomerase
MIKLVRSELNSHLNTLSEVINQMENDIEAACALAIKTLKRNGKILLIGNGGSAADAQHIAAELTGRYKTERKGLPAIALTTDTSAITAIGNDFGFDRIFERQIESLACEGDLVIVITTSGNSLNISRALVEAKRRGCSTLGLLGKNGGSAKDLCDIVLTVPSNNTPRIQEMHILFGHIICHGIDLAFA